MEPTTEAIESKPAASGAVGECIRRKCMTKRQLHLFTASLLIAFMLLYAVVSARRGAAEASQLEYEVSRLQDEVEKLENNNNDLELKVGELELQVGELEDQKSWRR